MDFPFNIIRDKKKRQYFYLLFMAFILAMITAGTVEVHDPANAGMDMNKYYEMAESSPGINQNLIAPFVYRIGAPWLAGLLPFSLDINFYLLNSIFLFLLAATLFFLMLDYKIDIKLSFLIAFIFMFNRYFFQFLAWDFYQLGDTVSYFLLFLSVIFIREKKLFSLSIALAVCSVFREVSVLIIPFGLAYFLFRKDFNSIWKFILAIVPSLIVLVIIRIAINTPDEINFQLLLLEGMDKILSAEGFLKTFIIPFAPFILLPFWYWRKTIVFIKDHPAEIIFFIFVVLSTLAGSDTERLMTPAAPVFYLLLAGIIVIDKEKLKNKFYPVLSAIAFFHSFYHLWGLIRLPEPVYSMISTAVLSLISLAVVIIYKSKK